MSDASVQAGLNARRAESPWWRSAVVYQVYIRSFTDGDGDGIGDIAGLRSRLPYLASLGVDAVWINPWYPSPMKDAGYDVSDFRAIEPVFGTLSDAEAMIAEAHRLGIRVLLDIVPNRGSGHRWLVGSLVTVAALAWPAWWRDRSCAQRAVGPLERLGYPAQAPVVLMPLSIEMAPDHDRGDGAGAGGLERCSGALGARAGGPRVVDQEDGVALERLRRGLELGVAEGSGRDVALAGAQ